VWLGDRTLSVIGHVNDDKYEWFVLSDNRVVSFHTAYLDKERTEQTTFFSDSDTFASVTAQQLGIKATFIRNATEAETNKFIIENELVIQDRIEI